MKSLLIITLFLFSTKSFAYKLRYGEKGEIKTITLRLATIHDQKIELFGADDSIAVRKLKRLTKKQVNPTMDKKMTLGSYVCKDVLKSDVVLGISEFNSSISFCLFKDGSLIPIDSLTSWSKKSFK